MQLMKITSNLVPNAVGQCVAQLAKSPQIISPNANTLHPEGPRCCIQKGKTPFTHLDGFQITISTFGSTHPSYQCVTVLRCLYQKQFLSETWKKIDLLQSHCAERKLTSKYEKDRVSIAQFILNFFKLRQVFTEEEILRVCGILMVRVLQEKCHF